MNAQKNRSRHISLAKCGLTLLLILSLFIVKAQTLTNAGEDKVYTQVDKNPEFPGGMKMLYAFIAKNIKYPREMKENGIQGNAIVQFIVEKDGTLSNIKSVRDPGHGSGEEAVRVISLSPKWIPGQQDGKRVRTQYTLPLHFALGTANK